MNRCYSNILKVLLLVAVVVVIVVANVSHRNTAIKDVAVTVDYLGNDTLVTAEQLRGQVLYKYRDITSQPVSEVDLDGIRALVKANPYVDEATVSVTVSADLMINITQRSPLVRVFTKKRQFYLDNKGRYMPISSVKNQCVIIANGAIDKDFPGKPKDLDLGALLASDPKAESYDIVKVYLLAKYINADPKAKALFDQIFINQDGDLEVVPKLGNHVVIIGNTENLDEKFENLYALYDKGFSKVGWDKYSIVNLKYIDQIICTKKQ